MAPSRLSLPPFPKEADLFDLKPRSNPSLIKRIPNEPCLPLDEASVNDFLSQELNTPILNKLYSNLWIITRKSGAHIDILSEHFVKQRSIIIVENPRLHLIWCENIVYLKPIPHCLLSHNFWETYLVPQRASQDSGSYSSDELSANCLLALGFLRSYAHLIRYESDFIIAQEAHLLPSATTFTAFQIFIHSFLTIPDDLVAVRYHFGQIRLSRLNYLVRILQPSEGFSWYYHKPYWKTGQFVKHYAAPIIFIFAPLSLILSAMQVVLAAPGDDAWRVLASVSWGFSVAVIVLITGLAVLAVTIVLGFLINQGLFSLRTHRGKEKKEDDEM
jgi:hypothetical protein